MKVSVGDQTITLTIQEMSDIIQGRMNAAMMDTKMHNGKDNPLSISYNDGVKIMAKYMGDYFMNEFDQEYNNICKKGDEW